MEMLLAAQEETIQRKNPSIPMASGLLLYILANRLDKELTWRARLQTILAASGENWQSLLDPYNFGAVVALRARDSLTHISCSLGRGERWKIMFAKESRGWAI